MIIDYLMKINRGLPDCNYYLDVSNFFINKSNNTIKEKSLRKLSKNIEETEQYLQIALNYFEKEKNHLNEIQIKGFILKKNLIKSRLELLKVLNLKYCEKN